MARNKVTQRQAIFYRLYNEWLKDREFYTPVWQLIGEIYVAEKRQWAFVSYECSARMSEMFTTNPNLFQRKQIEGRSGAKYYAYKIATDAKIEYFKDDSLVDFYKSIRQVRINEKANKERETQAN